MKVTNTDQKQVIEWLAKKFNISVNEVVTYIIEKGLTWCLLVNMTNEQRHSAFEAYNNKKFELTLKIAKQVYSDWIIDGKMN